MSDGYAHMPLTLINLCLMVDGERKTTITLTLTVWTGKGPESGPFQTVYARQRCKADKPGNSGSETHSHIMPI